MKPFVRFAALVLAAALPLAVRAAPVHIGFSARLADSGTPVTGSKTVVVKLYDAASGGASLWTETHASVAVAAGVAHLVLGSETPLDDALLNGAPLYLEITVDATTLSPRLEVLDVPYAVRASKAGSALTCTTAASADTLGAIAPSDVVTAVDGTFPMVVTRSGNTRTVSLPTCAAGTILKTSAPGNWYCTADAVTGATPPLAMSGTNVTLSSAGCTPGEMWKWTAGGWDCQPDTDTDTTYSAVSPIALTGSTFSLSTSGCLAGEAWQWTGTTWACNSVGDISAVIAGTGLSGGGTNGSVSLAVNTATEETVTSAPFVPAVITVNHHFCAPARSVGDCSARLDAAGDWLLRAGAGDTCYFNCF